MEAKFAPLNKPTDCSSLLTLKQSGTMLPDVNGQALLAPRRHGPDDKKKTATIAAPPYGGGQMGAHQSMSDSQPGNSH
mgnify:CR=1 FL=1